jgi:NADH dehydrogenase
MQVVTGAGGYIGRYITAALLERGHELRSITTHIHRSSPFGEAVPFFPYDFDQPARLVEHLRGAETLYNTYWVRFPHGGHNYERALEHTRILFACAAEAGVQRIVHIGVTHSSLDSPLPYYRGKASQDELLKACGVPFCILRPTLVFGREDILVNNIAWFMRKFPLFPVFAGGNYKVQPVYVGDVAALALHLAEGPPGVEIDALGPESFTFRGMLELMRETLGLSTRLFSCPAALGLCAGRLLGSLLGDVVLTSNELRGLMAENLTSSQEPRGATSFRQWLLDHRSTVGSVYTSELRRHFH